MPFQINFAKQRVVIGDHWLSFGEKGVWERGGVGNLKLDVQSPGGENLDVDGQWGGGGLEN